MARPLTESELALLNRLLDADFEGRDELRSQVEGAQVETIAKYDDNYGSFEFSSQRSVGERLAHVSQRVPVEARAYDEDGVPIDILLHVVKGRLDEVEIVRADLQPILKMPDPSEFDVLVRKPPSS